VVMTSSGEGYSLTVADPIATLSDN